MITQEYLKSILHYNPETGIFIWIINRPKVKINKIAGYASKNGGYVRIGIDGKYYMAHRLAWFYMTGEWPKELVDHKDNDILNNKWNNLREANRQQNNWNKKQAKRNKSGIKGVSEYKGKFRVYLCLGTYDTKEKAAKVYNEAAIKLHGEFAHKSIVAKQ